MKPSRSILLALSLFVTTAAAQTTGQALILDMGSGQYLGIVVTANGDLIVLNNVTLVTPTPPTPPKKAEWAAILYESETAGTDVAPILTASITDPALSSKVRMRFDQDAKDPDHEPLEVVQQALKLRRADAQRDGQPILPAVVGFSSGGSPVVSDKLPTTVDGLKQLLRRWGL